ncbi:MAG: hypothetical protein AUH75_10265 [Gemmatimonadetes bacterium 13_1_40CM_4_65_7]|nr:MAG: hypothetical protein AUH75_10265 [Gemmatimonadetes bacterium 13_1_40CM_4_65_7]
MWRWTMRILVGLGGFLIVAALSGATYQWFATRKDLASTPPPGLGGLTQFESLRPRTVLVDARR